MTILLTLVYVVVCVFLIVVVLLQAGKRADLAGAFGGGGSQTAFGARGAATFLSKLTTVFAALFMLLALALAILHSRGANIEGSVLDEIDTAPMVEPGDTEGALPPPGTELPPETPPEAPPAP